MELKEAMEAATADLDVRPGFVGDVMAGARRRHTRKLLAVTAAVALLAGLVTGIVLTSDKAGYTTDDPRLTAATGGDLAGDSQLATRALTTWRNAQDEAWRQKAAVTEVSARPKVFWAGMTPSGPVALVAQAVRVRNSPDPQTLVGLVHDDAVVGFDVAYEDEPLSESGIYRFGPDDSTYVVLTLGLRIFWSADPVRGPDLRYSRTWWQAETRDGVAVIAVADSRHPVFVRSDTAPAADDFTRQQLVPDTDTGRQKAIEPWPGLGWKSTMWASRRQEPSMPGSDVNRSVFEDLRKRGYVDYGLPYTPWQVHAWLPDGRFAIVLEMQGELFCALYLADGTFDRVLTGGPAVKGAPIPVRIALPDGQGTILAERGVLLGPDEQEDAWIAPPGTTEVTVWHSGSSTVVPL